MTSAAFKFSDSFHPVLAPTLVAVGSQRTPVRIGLIGASDLVAHGLSSILDHHSSRVAFIDATSRPPHEFDLVLLDISLGHDEGPKRVRDLIRTGFSSILVFGWGLAPGEEQRFEAAGACGHVSMRLDAPTLVSTLESAHIQQFSQTPHHATPDLVRHQDLQQHVWQQHAALRQIGCSPREEQVLTLICRGRTNNEIAMELFLSINTVKTYIRSAYRRIGLTRRTQVVLWGIQHGL